MKVAKFTLIPFIVVLGASFFLETAALACGCPSIAGIEQETKWKFQNSKAVFAGTVMETEHSGSRSKTTFRVEKWWKGPLTEEIAILGDGGSCEYPFQIGGKYLVFAFAGELGGTLRTGSCSGNLPMERATEKLAILGKGVHFVPRRTASRDDDCVNGLVRVKESEDAPVRLSIREAKCDDSRVSAKLTLRNVGDKLVTSYEVSSIRDYENKKGVKISQSVKGIILSPGDVKEIVDNGGFTNGKSDGEPVGKLERLVIWVSFIEFVDGSKWEYVGAER